MITEILQKDEFTKADLLQLLKVEGQDLDLLFAKSNEIKKKYVGNKVYLRGLIEFSNVCLKNCYYCGIRQSNESVSRFNVKDDDILAMVQFAYENNYASLALQSGEIENPTFALRVENLLKKISSLSNNTLGVTLSCGEQSKETYQRWFDAGARRYLLRIETSSPELYQKLHPSDTLHSFTRRLECLKNLQSIGYQTGTGVMIGLPFQSIENLADDLLFMKRFDIDMCGMGPYILHRETPLAKYENLLLPDKERLKLSLKMIAILRILMKDINIASTTALQSLCVDAREKAVEIGANVLMPNITPGTYRNDYNLYERKPKTSLQFEGKEEKITTQKFGTVPIGYGQCGDAPHFFNRKKTSV